MTINIKMMAIVSLSIVSGQEACQKKMLTFDEWLKDIAPTTVLRKWFAHKPERFNEFRKRYKKELQDHKEELDKLRSKAKSEKITLLFAAKDAKMNNAVVVKEVIEGK